MSVYIIKPSGIKNYYKIGYTKRRTEKETREYLYKRYRTPFGADMEIKYLKTWKTDAIGLRKEKQMFALLAKYRNNPRDEIFICSYGKIKKAIPTLEKNNETVIVDTSSCCVICVIL